jgi:hypothetical protein
MPKGDIETFHMVGEWHNRINSEIGVVSSHPDKKTAVNAGHKAAQQRKVAHIIRNMDGTISEKNSYGHDPRDVPG